MTGFQYDKDAAGVVTVTMDMDGAVNSMSSAFLPALRDTVEKLEQEEGLSGVVVASAKKNLFRGRRSQFTVSGYTGKRGDVLQ